MTDDALICDTSSYPGGKSGAGIFQRLINLIPCHRVLLVPFAGHCGVVRNIRAAEHTIVIDANPDVCDWWARWCRTKRGRALEIHNCDGIEWMRYRFGLFRYRDAGSCVSRATRKKEAEYFVFCDPPYVLSGRLGGRIYECELTDDDHRRFIDTVTAMDATGDDRCIMICGYASHLYSSIDEWDSIDHRVPTRHGLQDERIWINYPRPEKLHDYRYIGKNRRERERIRRRQKNWLSQLSAMTELERIGMIEALGVDMERRGASSN
jgi:DNA adenine methylase